MKNDKSVSVINKPADFKSFIGKVDNIEEVKLLIKSSGYSINLKDSKTGSYLEQADKYLLYICQPESFCLLPQDEEKITSVKAVLTKSGNLTIPSNE